ncbi:DNA sulfur modification protein DndB [Geodermatophilus normandii]|uniref:DNA sulfur modification protein DndB n=1 Tax=Geodermatophilus normandii TaxID=1137989 RepID=A0A317QKE2_9ACTN|nr:DNA sulfur modification protein DndB [Geodermatophilus normandii]PWW23479.1 DNA sulfur modification protein DndB [Geodermatophilus normandii]
MSVTRPCLRGRMGSTTYYEITMTARELTTSVRPARETDSWASASLDERIQREVNETRVRETIVPYLAKHEDRFFGSFIVLVPQGAVTFEGLSDLNVNLPAAYDVGNMGFLTLKKGELVALDGQHRLVAFRQVITTGQQLGPYSSVVGDDEVCVLVIEMESPTKTRRIFNKVNRHAKPTGRSDNIITSEDDGYAIVSRRLLDQAHEGPLAPIGEVGGDQRDLVTWRSTTLSRQSDLLTTLSTVYETVTDILSYSGYSGFSEKEDPVAPPDDVLDKAFDVAAGWWSAILTLEVFRTALHNPSSVPVTRADSTHKWSLLLRPVGQMALVRGLIRAMDRSRGELSREKALERAGRLSWKASPDSYWRDTIVNAAGRMIARKEAVDLAADLLAYLVAPEWTSEEEKSDLYERWNKARGRDPFSDVEDLPEEEIPEELPAPGID